MGEESHAPLPYVRLLDNVAQGLVPTVALDGNEGGSTNACRLVGPGKRSETCRLAAATADALLDLHARGEAVRSGSVQLPDQGHSFGVSQLPAAGGTVRTVEGLPDSCRRQAVVAGSGSGGRPPGVPRCCRLAMRGPFSGRLGRCCRIPAGYVVAASRPAGQHLDA